LAEGVAEGLCRRCLLEAGLGDTLTTEHRATPASLGNAPAALPDFGPYHTIGVLGEGGMGIVYLAEQHEPVRRRVALKVLKSGDAGSQVLARFASESQALALMDHPNIARIYDAGTTASGRPYFAMEYVPGIPITDYCDRNLLGFRERLTLFQQVCQAVHHAHQKGVIHRDLKPSNVLVMLQDGKPVPKVIDFGVAKAVNQRLTEKTLFTEIGMLIGTPEYMSPEQADLTGLDIDSTTDVYSLGVLLYELLVGALPFDSKSLRKAGCAEIQRVIRETEPPRPSARLSTMGEAAQEVARHRRSDVRTLVRLLRGDLEWITMKALEKDRTRRYASASDFAADIGRHLASEPVAAGPPSLTYRLRKAVRRNRGKLAAVAAAFAALAFGLIPSVLQRQPAGPTTMTQHKIDIQALWPQATDGRRMVYRDDATGELIYSELGTKMRRVVFKAKPDDLPDWMPSRDFSMVALQFETRPNRPGFVAIVRIDGKGYRELIREQRHHEFGGHLDSIGGMANWSWDNRYLLIQLVNQDPQRILIVSTTSGERRELFSQKSGDFRPCAFSPDGRFVACICRPPLDFPGRSRLFMLPVQGGEPHLVTDGPSSNFNLFDWTADGRYLVVLSPQFDKPALQLLPVKDGAADGEPILIQPGRIMAAATTKAGRLIYRRAKPGGFWPVHLASLDEGGRPGNWRKLDLPGENYDVNPWPNWSPDGTRVVYTTQDVDATSGSSVVRVRDFGTGKDREIYRTREYVECVWATRQATLFCSSWAADTEILAIAPDSGQVERLGRFPACMAFVWGASGDGRALFLVKLAKEKTTVRWDIATGRETILDKGPAKDDYATLLSPDEQWLARMDHYQVEVKPTSGADWKALVSSHFEHPQFIFTPDSKWLLYHDLDSAGRHGLFRVPVAGGTAERLGDFPSTSSGGSIVVSPDGRQVIVASFEYEHAYELWALDNFIPGK
jgi:serine/threonine protein kinase/Tol biopolymer transport system component